MKKIILTLAIIGIVGLSAATAQPNNTQPNNNYTGTWVVESNLHKPGIQTVRFYDNNNRLIYSETINGHLNVSKKKVQQKLNNILELLATQNKPAKDSDMLVLAFRVRH
jgi:hypothetical protein